MLQNQLMLAGLEVDREETCDREHRPARGLPSRIEVLVHDQARGRLQRGPQAKLARRPAQQLRASCRHRLDPLLRDAPEPERPRHRPIESAVTSCRSDPALRKQRQ